MARRVVSVAFLAITAFAGTILLADSPVHTVHGAAAGNTRIMLFNQTPAAGFSVRRNNVAAGTAVAGPSGVVVYETNAVSGDRYEFLMTGVTPVTPAQPSGFVATGDTQGCVSVSWNPPASSDYVTGYSLLWRTGAGAYTDSVIIDALDISKGAKWVSGRCGMPTGTYTFALRAHNSFDRWSTLSAPGSTSITNQDTQGPTPPTNVKVTESSFGCASVTWTRSGDPDVTGYRVYLGTKPRAQGAYSDSIDAANAAAAQKCGLSAGSYYFSVRAYTALGIVSAYSKEVMLAARGTDILGPTITQRMPAPGAINVPRNAVIFFVVADDKTGVNTSAISVTINGTSYPFTTSVVAGGFAVQCDPPGDFAADSDVPVALSVPDLATPPNVSTRTYSFHTGTGTLTDTDPPVLTATAPTANSVGIDTRPTIDVRVVDAGLGVDFSSLVMTVNGTAVTYSIEGDPADAHVRFRPANPFAYESVVHVRVDACDRGGPANCATLTYDFTVRSADAALAGQGAIVPDGFWANDPDRPLEVRDLPGRWSIRIFDTSGAIVRHHENDADGATWTWNFRNDQGQRVAPALYLVRVTDAGGAVQRSGRFLVQSGR